MTERPAKRPPPPSPNAIRVRPDAFARRLKQGLLTPDDKALIERARIVKERTAAGVPMAKIAEEVGIAERSLSEWMTHGPASVALAHLNHEDDIDEETRLERIKKAENARLEALGTHALDFYEDCFRRKEEPDGKGGSRRVWEDRPLAQWATDRISKKKGWDTPTKAQRPVIQVGSLTIIQQMGAVAADDAKILARSQGAPIDAEFTEA